ncbi:hypothetical protein V6Z12_A03G160200 [Gossypium hirsutum]
MQQFFESIWFGAEMVFSSKDSTITDEDIDRIIAKGEAVTAELDAKMKKFIEDAIKFKMDDTAELYEFDDDKDENKFDIKKIVSENWIEPPKRERKRKEESAWHLLMRYCAGFTEQSKRMRTTYYNSHHHSTDWRLYKHNLALMRLLITLNNRQFSLGKSLEI